MWYTCNQYNVAYQLYFNKEKSHLPVLHKHFATSSILLTPLFSAETPQVRQWFPNHRVSQPSFLPIRALPQPLRLAWTFPLSSLTQHYFNLLLSLWSIFFHLCYWPHCFRYLLNLGILRSPITLESLFQISPIFIALIITPWECLLNLDHQTNPDLNFWSISIWNTKYTTLEPRFIIFVPKSPLLLSFL